MPRFRNLEPTSDFWSWRDHGACLGHEDLFYSAEDESKGERRRKEEKAKQVCAVCPVFDTCRQFAIESKELYGVWGGLTESDRHKIAGRQRTG
ncbi:WhiB family transcriptional regulator [Dietzia sp. UBA5065]|jgi:WhiB family redox-sensing transcriptional regulator|uniref:WhiB family transcriptional regulator n=1 Tax=Dietzia sp. UBA5065 TaxID=1946422 RepID=UPI0025C10A65|nr:WhiB family transcriptional regulator [Dietzia sp. UBA5065]HMT49938.1 WhiB family transcriptional regulator [Dietzia sp.]